MSLQDPSHNLLPPQPETHADKPPVSERRILANCRNALRSTGPKTMRGKRTVSRNAITHGILAGEVVITAGDGEESQEEFDALIEDLENCYQPVGAVEELHLQKIATALWRKARVLRAENGEIRRQLDTAAAERMLRSSDKSNFDLALQEMGWRLHNPESPTDQKASTMDRWSAMQVAQSNLREHLSGLEYLIALLRGAKSEIQSDGYISQELRKKIFSTVCLWDYGLALTCVNAGPGRAGMKDPISTTEMSNADVVAILENRLEGLGALKEYVVERETLAEDAEARSLSLPSPSERTSYSATRLTLTGNFLAAWTNWNVCNGDAKAKTCRRLSMSIWVGGPRPFCETKPRTHLFSLGGPLTWGGAKPNIALQRSCSPWSWAGEDAPEMMPAGVTLHGSEETGPRTAERLPPFRHAAWKAKLGCVLQGSHAAAVAALIMLANS
jgi:hypothetical protein